MPNPRAIRVCLDVNVWVAHLLALKAGRTGTAASNLVQLVTEMICPAGEVQLMIAWRTLGTLEDVLGRLGFPQQDVSEFGSALVGLMKAGPECFDPHLVAEGGGHLPMHDKEDAGVLAAAIAARVDLLVTDNLKDFALPGGEVVETQMVPLRGKPDRQLFAVAYERNDGVSLVVAHPIDALDWLGRGIVPTPDFVRSFRASKP